MNTLVPSSLIVSSSFLQEIRTCIYASNFNQIRPLTTELVAHERLKNDCIML